MWGGARLRGDMWARLADPAGAVGQLVTSALAKRAHAIEQKITM
jgi:hypothetical protein